MYAFINALCRFIRRRGQIRRLRSNQGSNFVGAKHELKAQRTHPKGALQENYEWITFVMNVPSSSHMSGDWERQIRSVRSVLSLLLQNEALLPNGESLRTLMCEVEAIIDSRPLSIYLLNDPGSLSPLSPDHLLTMKTKVVLSPPDIFPSAEKFCRKRRRFATAIPKHIHTYSFSRSTREGGCHPRFLRIR